MTPEPKPIQTNKRTKQNKSSDITTITFISNAFKYDVDETSVDNVLTILFIEGQVNLIQIY
jgi:hypothetical protein